MKIISGVLIAIPIFQETRINVSFADGQRKIGSVQIRAVMTIVQRRNAICTVLLYANFKSDILLTKSVSQIISYSLSYIFHSFKRVHIPQKEYG